MLAKEYKAMLAVCIKSIADLESKVRELEDRLRASCPHPEEAPRGTLRKSAKNSIQHTQPKICATCIHLVNGSCKTTKGCYRHDGWEPSKLQAGA